MMKSSQVTGGEGHTLYLYDYDPESKQWKRSVIDQSIAVQGIAVGDINQDGLPDFTAAGGSTHNVKLFINQHKKEGN